MITQMRNQDPTNPFKAEQMATEMAQFTSVEQMQNINTNLQKMATANQPLERLAMTGLIGKSVTIDRDRFAHIEGNNESLSYSLPKKAAEVKLAIISADTGETVLEQDLGPTNPGEQAFSWDGKKVNTLPAKAGNYMFRIEAKDERGAPIQSNPMKQTRVVGVSFEGNEPILLVGDNKHQERVTMKSVIKIDGGESSMQSAQAAPAMPGGAGQGGSAVAVADGGPASGAAPEAPAGGKFFSFTKGVGSENLDPNALPPEMAKALKAAEVKPEEVAKTAVNPRAALESLNAGNADKEKGFANGLNEGREAPVERPANPAQPKAQAANSPSLQMPFSR